MSEANKAMVQRLVKEVWSDGNLDVLDEIIHPEAHPPHGPWDLQKGTEGFKHLVSMIRTSFPDLRRTVEDMAADGDRVVLYYTLHGTHAGGGGIVPFPPSSEVWDMHGVTAFRFVDGKIFEEPWAVNSVSAMIQQVAKATVRAVFEQVWNGGNLDVIEKFYAPGFVYHTPGGEDNIGYDAIRRQFNELREECPQCRFEIQQQIAEANKVLTHWRMASNGKYVHSGLSLIRHADGRLVEEWEFYG